MGKHQHKTGEPAVRRTRRAAWIVTALAMLTAGGAAPVVEGPAAAVPRAAEALHLDRATAAVPASSPAAVPIALPVVGSAPVLGVSSALTIADPVRLVQRTTIEAGESLTIRPPAPPAGTTAVALNVTADAATAETTLTACVPGSPCSVSSTLTTSPGPSTPAMLIAPVVGPEGEVRLANDRGSVTVHIDLVGFVHDADADADAGAGGGFIPAEPRRVLSWHELDAGSTAVLTVPEVPAGATAVALDLGSAAATARTSVSACAVGTSVKRCATTSVLSPVPGINRSNLTVVPLGGPQGDQVLLHNHRGSVRLNADVQGFFIASGGGLLRGTADTLLATTLTPGEPRTLRLATAPEGTSAVQLHVAARDAEDGTAVTICPGEQIADECARTSVVSPHPGRGTANTAFVALDAASGGAITVASTSASVHLTVTAVGYVVPAAEPEQASAAPTVPDPAPAPEPPPSAPGTREPRSGGSGTGGGVGVPDGVALTRHDGDLVITEPGTVLDGMDIHGFVSIRAADVTIRNSVVRGSGPGSTSTGLVSCLDAACTGAVVEDTTLVPKHPSVWITGILGHDFTARRVDVHHVVDGFGIFDTNDPGGPVDVVIADSWCHDLSYFARDPHQGGGATHNDCIQIQGGSNITITGNRLESFMSTAVGDQSYDARNRGAALMVTSNVGPVTGARVTGNRLDGGYASASFSPGKHASMAFGTFADNRFGRDQFDHGRGSRYVIRVRKGVSFDRPLTTNAWADGAGPLAAGRDLGIRYDD